MVFFRQTCIATCAALFLACGAAVPAFAAPVFEPLTLGAGLQTGTSPSLVDGQATLADFTASYDVGPKLAIPLRFALEANYESDTRSQGQTAVGGGLTLRATTPLYAGVGFGVYSISVPEMESSPLLFGEPGTSVAAPANLRFRAVQVAPEFFIGDRVYSAPGVTISVQATYRVFPTSGVSPSSFNEYPSNVGLGLRVKL